MSAVYPTEHIYSIKPLIIIINPIGISFVQTLSMKRKLHQISILLGVIIALIAMLIYSKPAWESSVFSKNNKPPAEKEEEQHSNLLSASSKIVRTLLSIRP